MQGKIEQITSEITEIEGLIIKAEGESLAAKDGHVEELEKRVTEE